MLNGNFPVMEGDDVKQRGRRSAANVAVNVIGSLGHRLEAPDHLTVDEQQIFSEVVALSPPGHFVPADVFLISTFAQVTAIIREAATNARKAKPTARPAAYKQLQEMAKTQATLCTKLRMAPQSRIGARDAARRADKFSPSAYDLIEMNARGFQP
jgi:hypothetical protein